MMTTQVIDLLRQQYINVAVAAVLNSASQRMENIRDREGLAKAIDAAAQIAKEIALLGDEVQEEIDMPF